LGKKKIASIVLALMTLVLLDTSFVSSLTAAVTKTPQTITTATPIKHLIVIFQENVSFDHYFATYPNAKNPSGEPTFHASPDTPSVNGLSGSSLFNNTNQYQPFRFDRSRAVTCDMNHGYTAEQNATNGGLLDKFVKYTSPKYCNQSDRFKQVMGIL
jgi:phospholipase C